MSDFASLNQIENELDQLSNSAYETIRNIDNDKELEVLRISLLGKKGKLSSILKNMGKLNSNQRPVLVIYHLYFYQNYPNTSPFKHF